MNCPNCNAVLDRHETRDEKNTLPADGDLSVCLYCATVSIFDDGKLRQATRDDIEKLAPSEAFELGECQARVLAKLEAK